MKHGVRFWNKKVGLPPDLAKKLKANLTTQLIVFERLNLTKAKAEWIKHHTDRLIDVAKGSLDAKAVGFLSENLEHSHLTLRKLCGPLAARYANMDDDYVRIIRYGSRGQGSNQAELAYIELVNQKYDSKYALALHRAKKLKEVIEQYEDQYFVKKETTIENPETNKEEILISYEFKPEMSNFEMQGARRRLVSAIKKRDADTHAIASYEEARMAEEKHVESARKDFEKRYGKIHEKLQKLVDREMETNGEISHELKNKLSLNYAYLEDKKVVPCKSLQDIAFETGELPELYTVDKNNWVQRLNPYRRATYYLDPKKTKRKAMKKFYRSYTIKRERFPLPSGSSEIPDAPSMGPPSNKKLTRKEFIDKYIDLATPKLIKKYKMLKESQKNSNKEIPPV